MNVRQTKSAPIVATVIALAVLLGAASRQPAAASPESDACIGSPAQYSPDQRIAGCTFVIHGGALSQEDLVIAYFNRGIALYERHEYELAAGDFTQVIQLNPGDAQAFHERGNAYYAMDDVDEAIRDYQQAQRLDPSLKPPHGLPEAQPEISPETPREK